jgi:hypothetical protein
MDEGMYQCYLDMLLYDNSLLYEGLIYTHTIGSTCGSLHNHNIKTTKVDKEKNTIEIKVNKKTDFKKLFVLINNLGWFISQIKKKYFEDKRIFGIKYSSTNLQLILNDEDVEEIFFILEAKFDIEVDITRYKYIYHLSNSDYLPKIKRNGLIPKSKDITAHHPERLYFYLNKDDIKYLIPKLTTDIKKAIIITFETNNLLSNIRFFKDPNFLDKGVYTLDNISYDYIYKIENI